MSFDRELDEVTGEAIAMFGKEGGRQLTFTYAGVAIPCYEEDEKVVHELVLGGLAEATDKVLRCRKRAFPGGLLPIRKQEVSLDGTAWRVRDVAGSHGDPEVRLTLFAQNKR